MDYFNATFFDKYSALTAEAIQAKLTPVPTPEGNSESAGLAGRSIEIILDNGTVLDYAFEAEVLTLAENKGTAISAPYAARTMSGITLVSHMVPDTMRGYNLVIEEATGIVTVFDVWFGGFARDLREVWREYLTGYIKTDGEPPAGRHSLTNRIEGAGTYWEDDSGKRMLYFFPSVVWSSFIDLSSPRGEITVTAPSDYLKINDCLYIYSRVEAEYGGAFVLEVIDFLSVKHIGVRLGFDLKDQLEYRMYSGKGKVTGRSTNLEPLTDYGTQLPFGDAMKNYLASLGRGGRPSYRPRFMHKDYTQEEVNEIIDTNSKMFEGRSIMTSRNTMEVSDYMVGFRFSLAYDDGPEWEYQIESKKKLLWREAGTEAWQEENYEGFEAAKDIIIFSHVCTGKKPLRCLTHAVDFSNSLTTCVDAFVGNGRKPWETKHKAIFGVLKMEGAPEPPVTRRHGFTRDLLGKAYAWTYGEHMQSIHVYSSPESYSWTIMMPNNTGGVMWSSPCLYVKLREDAYLMSWTEDTCNGNQGTFILNPWLMHDAGFFFGIGEQEEKPDIHLHSLGAFARPLSGFDIAAYYEETQK